MKFIGSLLLMLFALELFGAEAYLQNKVVFEGESATLVIHIKGKNIRLKRIHKIEGYNVVDHGGHFETKIVNGEKIRDVYYEATFYPKSSMTISALEFKVDGKIERTNPVELILEDNPAKPYIFEAFVNKDNPIENEIIKYSLRFKHLNKKKFKFSKFIKPDFPGLWLEGVGYGSTYIEGDYIVHGIDYYITAKKTGDLIIGEAGLEAEEIGDYDELSYRMHAREFASKTVKIHVKPMTHNAELVGNFSIKTFTNKKVIEGNEMLQVIVKVKGEGNFNDIEPFILNLKEATVTNKDARIRTFPRDGTIKGSLVQDFYVGNAKKDFVIPPFKLTFYDLKTKTVRTAQSNSISIHVNNPIIEHELRGGKEELKPEIKKGFQVYSLNIIIGFLFGVIFILAMQVIMKKKHSKKTIKPTNNKTLLQMLFAYKGQSNNIDELIEKLEGKLYKNSKVTISSKEINEALKYLSKNQVS